METDNRKYEYRTLLHRNQDGRTPSVPIDLAHHDDEGRLILSFLYHKYRMWDVESFRREVGEWEMIDKRTVTASGEFADWPKDSEIVVPDGSYEYCIDFDNPLRGSKFLNDGSISDRHPRRLDRTTMSVTDDIDEAYRLCDANSICDGTRWVKLFRRPVGEWKSWRRSGLPPKSMDVKQVREEWERLLGAWQ